MDFSVQLSADYPDTSYGGDRVYADMLDQARLADRLGFDAVSLTEHHLINCLMMPAPLTFATKIASETNHIKIMTSNGSKSIGSRSSNPTSYLSSLQSLCLAVAD